MSRSRPCCARLAPMLLVHLNLLLAVYAGAGLATAARLAWDPSAYVPLRELFPLEYRATVALLPAAAAALLLLAHLAPAALAARQPSTRRILLLLYWWLMVALVCAEAAWAAWVAWRVGGWARGAAARELRRALQLRDHVLPVLELLGRLHPLPQRVKDLMQEAEADVPRNLYAAGAAAALLAALQPLAAALALVLAARARAAPRRPSLSWATSATSAASGVSGVSGASGTRAALGAAGDGLAGDADAEADSDRAPLRTAYKNGRIVIL